MGGRGSCPARRGEPDNFASVTRQLHRWTFKRWGRVALVCLSVSVAFGITPASSAQVSPNDYSQAEALVRNHQWDAGLALLLPMLKNDAKDLRVINLTALAFTGKGEVSQADDYFERALKIDPGFLPALKNLAINEFNTDKYSDAKRHLSLALKQAPDDPVINLYLGELAYKQNNFAQVVVTLPKAESFFARDANLAAHLSIGYLTLGETQYAISLLGQAPPAKLDPSSQFAIGGKLASRGLFDAAIAYLIAARDSHPESYDVAFDLALCYLNLKRYPDAIAVLQETISRGRENSELNNMLAEAYEGNHETQNAIVALRRAIAIAPDDMDNYLDFASICIDHQDYLAAFKVIQAGLQTNPNSDRLFFERGILYAVQDNFQLAEQDFKRAAALSPGKDSNYKGLGILYLESGKGAQAVETLKRRLKSKPDDPDLLYLLGEALLRSGGQPGDAPHREAQASFEKAVQLNPGLCLARVSLGRMYLEQGSVEDAVSQLEKARTSDPKEKSTYWQLAMAYRRLGEPEKQTEVLLILKKLNDEERTGSKGRTGSSEPASQISETN
jgi:tetratricopeptide (TPR) repeat protein